MQVIARHRQHVDVLEDAAARRRWRRSAGPPRSPRRGRERARAPWPRWASRGCSLSDRLGDQRQRALRADDQLGQVVAGGRLRRTCRRCGSPRRCRARPRGRARCCRVTPYFTARMPPALVATLPPRLALSSRRGRPGRRARPAVVLVELVERDAGLHDGDVVVGVDLEDRVHPLERTRRRRPAPAARHRTGRSRSRARSPARRARSPIPRIAATSSAARAARRAAGACGVGVSASSWP